MPQTRRAQVLLEPGEYVQLEEIARRAHVSVSGLIRDAVRERYFRAAPDRRAVVSELLSMHLPVTEDWRELGRMIEEAHGDDLP